MADPKLGTKRLCDGCGAKYYDLNKDPAVCPKCDTVFDPAVPTRKPAPERASKAPKAVADDDEDEREDLEDDEDISLEDLAEEEEIEDDLGEEIEDDLGEDFDDDEDEDVLLEDDDDVDLDDDDTLLEDDDED